MSFHSDMLFVGVHARGVWAGRPWRRRLVLGLRLAGERVPALAVAPEPNHEP